MRVYGMKNTHFLQFFIVFTIITRYDYADSVHYITVHGGVAEMSYFTAV